MKTLSKLLIIPFLFSCAAIQTKVDEVNEKVENVQRCMSDAKDLAKYLKDFVCEDEGAFCYKLLKRSKKAGE